MRVAYIGNFQAPWCTEVHVKRALELTGHEVVEYQENEPRSWERLEAEHELFDFVLWTRTWELDRQLTDRVLARVKGSVPIIGYHLDRWWGLAREREVHVQPFFRYCDVVCTADGGHAEAWKAAGVEHWWYPPAVLGEEAALDYPRFKGQPETPLVFVGSHRGYHAEWAYRMELVLWLRRRYGSSISWFPAPQNVFEYQWRGEVVRSGQVRGEGLNALYQHTPVIVGDSCLAGGATHYWSDRVPETIGRGGLLVHPFVEGLGLRSGEHYLGYELGNFEQLAAQIDVALQPEMRAHIVAAGRAHVLEHDTYEVRMRQLAAELQRRGLVAQ